MRAVVADADRDRREVLAAELRRRGYEPHESPVPQRAPELARELGALLVCVGGPGALDACRDLAGDGRIVVLVAEHDELARDDALAAGAADVWQVESGHDLRVQLAQHFARLQAENGELTLVRQVLAAEAAQRRSSFLAEASPLLDSTLDLRSTLDSVARLSVPFLGDACIVYEVRHDEVRRLAAAASDDAVEQMIRALPPAYPVAAGDPLARIIAGGRPEILQGAPVFGPDVPARLDGTAMAVPLKARGRIIGALAFATLDRERRYGREDLLVAEDLARRAALALDNARLYENLGSIARTLQEGLLPERLPALEQVELAARFRPAGDGSVIGGDFYDALPRPDGVDLVIGDVTGKGARAAGLTGLVRHTLRTAARYEQRPSAILDVVNRTLLAERNATGGRYCTVALARVTFGDVLRATICCAGHPMPMVVRREGRIEPVGRPGSVLGWVEDPKLLDVDFVLGGGESLVLYTDGVTEARTTGEAYGDAGLQELLRGAAGQDAAGIAARVDRAAARAGARRDDVAVLVGRVRP